MRNAKPKITKEQILCILAGLVLSVCVWFTEGEGRIRDAEGTPYLLRPDYGEISEEVEIRAQIGSREENLSITVTPRKYSEEEARKAFERIMDVLPGIMLSENESIAFVSRDLFFPSSLPEYPGISISFLPSDPELITYDGVLHNDLLEEAVTTQVTVVLSTGNIRQEFAVPLVAAPVGEGDESRREALLRLICQADTENVHENRLYLPREIHGEKVVYSEEKSRTPLAVFFLGIFSAVLLGVKPAEDEWKKKKERENELLMDYSEVVSKLIVYIGAGLTIRNAWEKLSENEDGRAVYREIRQTGTALKNGEPESEAYMKFGKRCGLRCYLRLAALLDQNRKTGDSALLDALTLEMDEAFEQQKNTAKRLGEEAETKLLLPLMMSLIVVLVIVCVPAIMSMG